MKLGHFSKKKKGGGEGGVGAVIKRNRVLICQIVACSIANCVDPDHTVLRTNLIWVFIACLGRSVPIHVLVLKILTILNYLLT